MRASASRTFGSLDEYVEFTGGTRVIRKVLIANNGIGAVKAIRSMRKWAYEMFMNERMVQFVVMATPEDLRANAEYIRLGDEIVDVPGGSNNNNYANVKLIVEIAERWEVDAVWAGWGHASENPDLPNSLAATSRKIVFIGPDGGPMQALGDKIGSTIIAQSAGVPTIGWNGDDIRVNYQQEGISDAVYDAADIKTVDQAVAESVRIGFPVMIKASAGGGGKGIRKVMTKEEVPDAFRQVQGEIPGSPIFVMKLAPRSRHLEVQVLADKYGNAIALNGRDCSVQRRHQKIIEEGPPVAAKPDVWREMERAAINLAKEVGYSNAGTVEYLYQVEDHKFCFLELNPRLQVEHPVTEMITKVNLPALQLQVAMGIPLYRMPDIRRLYGRHPFGVDTIDFETAERNPPHGHCIAVRITAENPDQGFQPTSGGIQELNFRSTPDVWGYFSVNSSGLVHEFADSQFGHLFAAGVDRESARKAMVLALKELSIRGDIRTTTEYIVQMMQSEDFVHNDIDTSWLDKRIAAHAELPTEHKHDPIKVVLAGAAVLAFQQAGKKADEYIDLLSKGQIPSESSVQVAFPMDVILNDVKYTVRCELCGPNIVTIYCNNQYATLHVRGLSDGGFLVNLVGRSHTLYLRTEPYGHRLIMDGQTYMFTKEYDPTTLVADVAGKLARALVVDGTHLQAGQPFAEIEVMKMFMPLRVREAGVISWKVSEGATLSPGVVIAKLHLDNPDCVKKVDVYTGGLGEHEYKPVVEPRIHVRMRDALKTLELLLQGFAIPEDQFQRAVEDFITAVSDPLLPVFEFEDLLSVLSGRINGDLYSALQDLVDEYKRDIQGGQESKGDDNAAPRFPAHQILTLLHEHAQTLSERDRAGFLSLTGNLWNTTEKYLYSPENRTLMALYQMLEAFIVLERNFDGQTYADAVNDLRKRHASELQVVFSMARSHSNVRNKIKFLLRGLRLVAEIQAKSGAARNETPQQLPNGKRAQAAITIQTFMPLLQELANLKDSVFSQVSLAATKLLIEQNSMSKDARRERVLQAIRSACDADSETRIKRIDAFIQESIPMRDVLLDCLQSDDKQFRATALEMYARKIYQKTHHIKDVRSGLDIDGKDAMWLRFDFMTRSAEALPTGLSVMSSFLDLAELARKGSESDSRDDPSRIPANVMRVCLFGVMQSFDDMQDLFEPLLSKIPQVPAVTPLRTHGPVNAIHVALLRAGDNQASSIVPRLTEFLAPHKAALAAVGVRRVSFFVGGDESGVPSIYTFRARFDFGEDELFRQIEPPHAFHLDLHRLSNFDISLANIVQANTGNVHIYEAIPKSSATIGEDGLKTKRLYARLVSFTDDVQNSDSERLFVEALDALGLLVAEQEANGTRPAQQLNHLFLNVVAPDVVIDPQFHEGKLRRIMTRYQDKLRRVGVAYVELKLTCRLAAEAEPVAVRLVASNPTGYVLRIDPYVEVQDETNVIFRSIGGREGEWDGQPVTRPYPVSRPFDHKRAMAASSSDTLYCYDYLDLFERSIELAWEQHIRERPQARVVVPHDLFTSVELVLCRNEHVQEVWTYQDAHTLELREINRPRGLNNVGMVAWLCTMRTPEAPHGRQVVLIANDITYKAGSFGTREDFMFFKASEYARTRGLPRIYLAANSGARIGLAESLKKKFKVAWNNPENPALGFKYLYLDPEEYDAVKASNIVRCERVNDDGEDRYMITDIIGQEPDLGVENLSGSGLIAGETARAYENSFTLTLVVGRTVGIGAYLVRLGQRTIQRTRNAPIILTGYQALNKLMGREIYTSNDQLGGPMIMYPNGISHLLAETHLDVVQAAVRWIGYVPANHGGYLPAIDITGVDNVERTVQFMPERGVPYDPRHLIAGYTNEITGNWVSGFFDKNSFMETLGGWARTVVTGRARLGGLPVGVIITENRTAEATTPADPADATSQERLIQQAGGVWFPDSAFKTAQALRDFNGEELPCFIFANWRGFSGGQRDMFDEVLKFGSQIVDALVAYNYPVFVYIPPFAELRGGAWVVVDSTINSDMMEMYAAENARGGVLEPNGAASIKFRARDMQAAAHRLDPVLRDLDAQLKGCTDMAEIDQLKTRIRQRESVLATVYEQLAVQFADLHDTPGRMEAVGVIRRQVQWAESRSYFYWRLRRRLAECDMARTLRKLNPEFTRTESLQQIHNWFKATASPAEQQIWEDDKRMLGWLKDHEPGLRNFMMEIHERAIMQQTEHLVMDEYPAFVAALKKIYRSLPPSQQQQFRQTLSSL